MARTTSTGSTRGLNVLIVEDDVADVGFLRSLLGRARLEIAELVEVRTLAAALGALAEHHIDVVLLDLGLPDTTGLDGATRITHAAPNVPIVVLTGADDDDLATRAATQDVQDYLVKWEFDPSLLARSIRYAVERHQLRVQLMEEKERAQRASRAKGEFLANMSHEIRAPMNIVLGMADLLRTGPLSPLQAEQLTRLQHAGDMLMDLIDNVLDLSRIEAGRVELDSDPFNLAELVTSVAEIVQPTASAKGLTLSTRIAADIPRTVLGDPRRLRQILMNLLANAIKFTEKGSVELLADRAVNGDVRFQVKDTGPGIPKERLGSVFEQFAQADASVARKHGGFGLGLAIASNLVRLMGGTIWVESEVGVGTTFHVNLRFQRQERTASGTMQRVTVDVNALVRSLSNRKTPIRILLIDDTEDNHELVRAYVADLPITVRSVLSGEEGLAEAAAEVFDLILVDMHLPGMDGCATLRAIRDMERATFAARTPMLVMSADVLTESMQAAEAAGSDGYISKPVRRVTLLAAILRHCGEKPTAENPKVEEAPKMDPTLAPILPRFLENRRLDCERMREATATRDFRRVAILAHNLKGTGGAFGYPDLSDLGAKLETLAKDGESAELLRSLDVLAERLDASSRHLAAQIAAQTTAAGSNGIHHG